MAYGDFKDLIRRTSSDKTFHNKVFNIAKIPKYYWYQRSLVSMVYKFFGKKTPVTYANKFASKAILKKNISNKELAKELHKPIIRKLKKGNQ